MELSGGQLIATVISTGVAMGGLLWRMQVVSDKKISGVYKRFDENKKHNDEKYVLSQVCEAKREGSDKALDKLEKRVDTGFRDVGTKLDQIIMSNVKP